MRRVLPTLLLGALLTTAAASAQERPSTAEARVHFDRAVALFESGDARGALAEFQRAYDLSGRASVLYNIGATQQALHDYPRAIDALRRFLTASEGRPSPQRELATRALRQMEPLVARLHVRVTPPGSTVTLDGSVLVGELAVVGPGAHTLAATAAGHEPSQAQVTVVSGDDREVSLALRPIATVGPIGRDPSVALMPSGPSSRAPFWAMVISGGALGLGASITGVVAIAAQRDYASRRVDDPAAPGLASRGRTLAVTADILAIGALGAGVTAVVLGLVGGRPSRATTVHVAVGSGGASIGVAGAF